MNNPLVSVIIPTYKRSDYLIRAINSVLNQTYKNIEIIVVDDNDGDNEFRISTINVLKNLIDNTNIIYIKHSINKGLPAARNTGVKVAKGTYIAFLDDDDEFLPTKIEKQLEVFFESENELGLVYGAFLRIDVNFDKEKVIIPKYKGNVNSILGLNHIGPPSMVMCTKLAIEKIGGFDESFRSREDIEFYFRLSEYFTVSYTNEIIMKYYVHSNAMSRIQKDKLLFLIRFIEKHKLNLKKSKLRWSELHERLGELNAINGNRKSALFAFSTAYYNRPTRLEIIAKFGLSFLGSKWYRKYRNVQ